MKPGIAAFRRLNLMKHLPMLLIAADALRHYIIGLESEFLRGVIVRQAAGHLAKQPGSYQPKMGMHFFACEGFENREG